MGLFGEAGARFLRTRYKNVQTLAEELFSVFSGAVDLTPQSITINQPAGATIPPIQINQPAGTTTPPIQINRGDTTITLGGTGGDGGGAGGINLGSVQFPGQDPGDKADATPSPALNPIMLHGQVVGKVGGKVYSLKCWAKNPSTSPPIGVLQVTFLDVDVDDVVPNGATCPVIMFPKIVFNVVQVDSCIGYVPVFYAPPGA